MDHDALVIARKFSAIFGCLGIAPINITIYKVVDHLNRDFESQIPVP